MFPSPVQCINFGFGFSVDVKRDDLIDPFISGNKWRKLKYLLLRAEEEQKSHLVSFGGAYSNHLLATAAAAARNGFHATGFVRGEQVHNEMLLLCSLFGMQLIFVDRGRYKDKPALFDAYFADDASAFFIDEGGSSAEAIRGCAEIISELSQPYDHIFCAAGTGSTAMGLLEGIINSQLRKTTLHVVPVLKGADLIRDEIEALAFRHDIPIKVHGDYHFGGYAKTNPILIEFIKTFCTNTGLLIDPVYTGKLCYAIHDLRIKGQFGVEDKILMLHSGGLFGIFGMKEQFL